MQESQGTCPAGKGGPRACHHLSQRPVRAQTTGPGSSKPGYEQPAPNVTQWACPELPCTDRDTAWRWQLLIPPELGAQSCCPGGNTDSRGPPPGPVPPLKDLPLTINAASVTKCSKPHAPQLSPPAWAAVRRVRGGPAVSGLTRLPLLPCHLAHPLSPGSSDSWSHIVLATLPGLATVREGLATVPVDWRGPSRSDHQQATIRCQQSCPRGTWGCYQICALRCKQHLQMLRSRSSGSRPLT